MASLIKNQVEGAAGSQGHQGRVPTGLGITREPMNISNDNLSFTREILVMSPLVIPSRIRTSRVNMARLVPTTMASTFTAKFYLQ